MSNQNIVHAFNFLEEPCKTPAESLQFAEETGIAIAWDETVRDAEFQQNPPHFFYASSESHCDQANVSGFYTTLC